MKTYPIETAPNEIWAQINDADFYFRKMKAAEQSAGLFMELVGSHVLHNDQVFDIARDEFLQAIKVHIDLLGKKER